jgi:hypothetical protein
MFLLTSFKISMHANNRIADSSCKHDRNNKKCSHAEPGRLNRDGLQKPNNGDRDRDILGRLRAVLNQLCPAILHHRRCLNLGLVTGSIRVSDGTSIK